MLMPDFVCLHLCAIKVETLFGPPSPECLNMEVNQSVSAYRDSQWPTVGFDGRDRIYIQPFASVGARTAAGAQEVAAFVRAYFQVPVRVLPALKLTTTRRKSKKSKNKVVPLSYWPVVNALSGHCHCLCRVERR